MGPRLLNWKLGQDDILTVGWFLKAGQKASPPAAIQAKRPRHSGGHPNLSGSPPRAVGDLSLPD
jgi:hypothetical protein